MHGRARTKREWKRNAADQHERESSCASVGAPVAIAESVVAVRRSRSRSRARGSETRYRTSELADLRQT